MVIGGANGVMRNIAISLAIVGNYVIVINVVLLSVDIWDFHEDL